MKHIDVIAAWNANNESSRLWGEITDRERIEFALRLAGNVEKQEPVAWNYELDKRAFKRLIASRVTSDTPLYTTPQPCPECEERKTTALNYISLTFEFEQLQAKCEKLKAERDELKAMSATEACATIPAIGEYVAQLERQRDDLAAQVTHWKANHASVVEQARILKERPDMPIERVKAYENWVAMAAQVEKMREALKTWKLAEKYALSYSRLDPEAGCADAYEQAIRERNEALALPDISTSIINMVRRLALREAVDLVIDLGDDGSTLDALAADREAGK